MPSAIFVCPFVAGRGPALDIAQLVGEPATDGYGYSCIGQVPQAPTCLVRITTSNATLDALDADANYLFVEDVPNGESD